MTNVNLKDLKIKGNILTDNINLIAYSTDASAYREKPVAVVIPKDKDDIGEIVKFAAKNKYPIIPRGAGTSLAGQVVGNGIVVDVSKHLNKILEINKEEHYVWVEPGVVLDELNIALKPYGLFFGPETSTSNRCTMGGMVGNNSCGAHLLWYGSTRDHTLAIKAFLSDGSEVEFKEISKTEFEEKCKLNTLEGKIYRNIKQILSDAENRQEIEKEYPHKSIPRRNTGYAIDLLMDTEPFTDTDKKFNFCKLLAGSEGTLAFAYAIKLNLVPLPPKYKALQCIHFSTIRQAMEANIHILKYNPSAVELMDKVILDCTKDNIDQRKNRFFLKGDPAAISIAEFNSDSKEDIEKRAAQLEKELRELGYGYHFPLVWGDDINKVWDLRKAGLGVLSNVPGDAKPVPVTEDTAVRVEDLPQYIEEFDNMLKKHGLDCVYYAHIGSGELHLRPMLNLKDPKHVQLFRDVALDSAKLVKKYRGSLSGEHGDGRLRGEFIPIMIGEHNYNLLKQIKKAWDPDGIFNPGKITDTPPMNTNLRYIPGQKDFKIKTIFDFSATKGYLRAAEKCTGSADCRKSNIIGGTMCPSYKATRDERNSTRARANMLREIITYGNEKNPFDNKDLYEVLDLCLSCKACKSECPAGVDVAKLKAEFLQHFYDNNGVPLRTKIIANIVKINKIASLMPNIANFFLTNKITASLFMRTFGFATQRRMPEYSKKTLKKWFEKNKQHANQIKGTVYLFNDEFTNYNESDIGIKAILLLTKLGYEVKIPAHTVSGRTYLSKGLVRKAKQIANENISRLADLITHDTPLIGIEPSAILTFRDEYPDLALPENKEKAQKLAKNALMIDEFLSREMKNGKISKDKFTKQARHIKLHGHCQQKAIASTEPTKYMLSFPENYTVEEIPSGCCGMAGSFGYEKEHYELSMKIGEMVLFPAVRSASAETIIAAPGTSCRHQIKDGTGKKAKHPVEILYEALV